MSLEIKLVCHYTAYAKWYLMKESKDNVFCKRWKLYAPRSLKGLIDKGVGETAQ